MGFLHIWLCLHLWICSFSSSTQILWIPTSYSGKFSKSVTYEEQHLFILLNQGLGSFPCGPPPFLQEEQTVHLCLFFSWHSWFYSLHHSLLRHPFPGWVLQSTFLGHSSFGKGSVPMTILVLLLWISLIFTVVSQETEQGWLNQDGQGEPWINKCHDKILCFVHYLFLCHIHCLFYLFHCCVTLLLHFHGTIHQNYNILLTTESPVFHMGS